MSFSIEDDDLDYSPTPLPCYNHDRPVDYIPTPLPCDDHDRPVDMLIINAFPDDHFVPEDSCLLGDRVVGTFGFCGALALLSSTCCCFCRGFHRAELANTFNRFTLFGMCCPWN